MFAVGKPSVRPRLSPATTGPAQRERPPEQPSRRSSTSPSASACRIELDPTFSPSSSSSGATSTRKPSSSPTCRMTPIVPARLRPSAKSGPTISSRICSSSTSSARKSRGESCASSDVNASTPTASSPSACSSSTRSSSEVRYVTATPGRRTVRGCGLNVSATAARSSARARSIRTGDEVLVAAVHAVEDADRHRGRPSRRDARQLAPRERDAHDRAASTSACRFAGGVAGSIEQPGASRKRTVVGLGAAPCAPRPSTSACSRSSSVRHGHAAHHRLARVREHVRERRVAVAVRRPSGTPRPGSPARRSRWLRSRQTWRTLNGAPRTSSRMRMSYGRPKRS